MEKHKELKSKLGSSLRSLKNEMEMVDTLLKKSDVGFHGAVQETRILQLQELAYEVEDFIEGLWEPGKYGYAVVAIGTDRRPQLLESIAGFKDRISSLQKEWKLGDESGKKRDDPDEDAAAPSHDSARCKDPEVIETPKKKLLELLSTSPPELRVISNSPSWVAVAWGRLLLPEQSMRTLMSVVNSTTLLGLKRRGARMHTAS
jgi:Sec-independent protein translocase protein TatA